MSENGFRLTVFCHARQMLTCKGRAALEQSGGARQRESRKGQKDSVDIGGGGSRR